MRSSPLEKGGGGSGCTPAIPGGPPHPSARIPVDQPGTKNTRATFGPQSPKRKPRRRPGVGPRGVGGTPTPPRDVPEMGTLLKMPVKPGNRGTAMLTIPTEGPRPRPHTNTAHRSAEPLRSAPPATRSPPFAASPGPSSSGPGLRPQVQRAPGGGGAEEGLRAHPPAPEAPVQPRRGTLP